MPWKERISLAVSLLALAVSLTTAYINLFYVKIDSYLILQNDLPELSPERGGIYGAYYAPTLTFINNGNRPFVVLGASLWLHPVTSFNVKRKDCAFQGMNSPELGIHTENAFTPVVLDPGKIVVIPLKFVASGAHWWRGIFPVGVDPHLLLTGHNADGSIKVVSCLALRFTSVRGKVESIERPISFTKAKSRGNEGWATEKPGPFYNGVPIALSVLPSDTNMKSTNDTWDRAGAPTSNQKTAH